MKDNYPRILPLPAFVPHRYKPGGRGAWSAHLAFANDLISATRPSLIVELGTHYGESYFTFCQSVAENRLACLCYSIDNWFGDEHAGYYGQEVIEDVERYNEAHYKHFSYLLRATFDEAVSQFADASIDLLHIDGLHTYEAANHDFRTWLPKVKPGGIVLLHDIAVRTGTFGIWRLWADLTAEFPETFAFQHGWGLGVLRKPGSSDRGQRPPNGLCAPNIGERGALLDLLFGSDPEIQNCIRRNYAIYAAYLDGMLASNVESPSPQAPETLLRLDRSLDAMANALNDWMHATDSQIEDLRARLIASDAERTRTLEELSQLATERTMRLDMEQSISWRITKPLRSIMRSLGIVRSQSAE